ncbi:MAG TPA: hypothetical protein VKP11_05825, partial [Frankiaceae bacterium]|nr:hypothetical protein [Frankiaceae bacterium]
MNARGFALAVACATLLSGAATTGAAQVPRYVGFDGGLSRVRFRSTSAAGGEQLAGIVARGLARGRAGAFAVEASYAQGRLSSDTGVAVDRDLVDGSVFVSARPVPWLAVGVGPHARAYAATAGGTERWMHFEGRVRAEGEILPGMLQAHLEGALALGSSVNVAAGAGGARSAEVGLTLRPPQSPVWVGV